MYHHVHDASYCLGQLGHLPVSDFKNQIAYLLNLDKKEMASYDQSNLGNQVVISLDDGLKSHFEFVAPVLENNGLKGVFYISSMPLLEEKVCNVHLCHYLLAYHNVSEICKFLESTQTITFEELEISRSYFDQNFDDVFKKIKTIFNYVLNSFESRDLLLFLLKRNNNFSEKWLLESLYMNVAEVRALIKSGHKIAPHFHSHTLLTQLNQKALFREFDLSVGLFEELTGEVVDEMCVPFGAEKSWSASCDVIALKFDITNIILVKPIEVICDTHSSALNYTSRVDCCMLKHGNYSY